MCSLHLVPQKAVTDAQLFANYMLENQLDCLKIVPSHLLALLSGTPHDRVADVLPKQVLVLGGEGISDSLLTLLSQAQGNVEGNDSPTACRLYNHYGPTETTVGVLWRRIYLSKQYDKQTSLSHSIGQNRIYLLDNNFAPAVTGQIAELYVAGPSLTRGYLNAPTQTAQVYLPNPFSVNGARMYRTGDLAVQRADKSIDIIGRSDHQVKVRGFRLDLQEIETLLCQLPSVQQASIQIQGQGDAAQLIGFVVSDAPDTSNKDNLRTPTALKKWLAERLPDYMIPSQLWVMPQFPLNNNGKLDGKALLAWASKQQANSYVSPKTDTESVVAQIWQDILNIEKISTVDNFFDLGGHSLSAIKVVATLRESIGRELPTNVLFQAQTIKELALFIDEKINVTHLQTISTVNKKAPTVVLMHNRGGHLDDYQVLIDSLAPYTNLFGLYPDNEVLNNSQPSDIEPLLARYAEHLLPLKSQALIFVGWSLAARQIVVLSDYLRKHGFTIKSLALIDYNPNETLHHSGDELSQLLDDVGYYVEENHPQPLDNVLWQIMTTTLNDDGITTYEHGLKALLRLPELQGIVGGSLSIDLITERVLERWRLKKMFYSNSIPRVDLPLWVWNGHTNKANIDDWQAYSSHGIEAWEIDADHFTILQSPTLSDQLLDCINGAAQAKITL